MHSHIQMMCELLGSRGGGGGGVSAGRSLFGVGGCNNKYIFVCLLASIHKEAADSSLSFQAQKEVNGWDGFIYCPSSAFSY